MMTLLFLSVVALGQDKACDLAHVVDALYCDTCKSILDDGAVDGEYCAKCSKTRKPEERKKVHSVKACLKEYYQATCHPDIRSFSPGSCCGKEMEKKTSKALVVYKCEACGRFGDTEGPCPAEACAKEKKRLRAVCTNSGTFPHVSRKK